MRISVRTVVALAFAVIAGAAAFHFMPAPLPELSRPEFLDEVRAGHVRRIEIRDEEVIRGESSTHGEFRTRFDKRKDAGLPDELRALGVEIWYGRSPLGI
jgi:hypothetical protein